MSFRFEGLEIFHAAIDFTVSVRAMARKFPADERFDLTSQVRRAANSIVLNIAEGSGRGTKKDFSHFLDMALGSTFETVACFMSPKGILTSQSRTWRKSKPRVNRWERELTHSRGR